MASENPYRPPDTPGKLVDEPVDVFGPRTYQRLIGQSRSAVIVLIVIGAGTCGLYFIQFLRDLKSILDIVGEDGNIWSVDSYFALLTFWKLLPALIYLFITLSLLAVSRAMRHLSHSRSTNLARLLLAENRFWWTAAVGFVFYVVSFAGLYLYASWNPARAFGEIEQFDEWAD